MTEEELQALLDEEEKYIQEWRDSLTQEQIDSIQRLRGGGGASLSSPKVSRANSPNPPDWMRLISRLDEVKSK